MVPVVLDARVVELVHLDVLDARLDGSLVLNADFRAECLAAYEADPSCLGTVFQDKILERAIERGLAGCVDLPGLALTALEIAASSEESAEAY